MVAKAAEPSTKFASAAFAACRLEIFSYFAVSGEKRKRAAASYMNSFSSMYVGTSSVCLKVFSVSKETDVTPLHCTKCQ